MAVGPDYRYTTGAPGWGRVATADAAAVDAGLRAYMLRVYNWMASGLLLTGTAYVIFAFAGSVWVLLLSRLVQGAGGGTIGVVQAYVADASVPEERTKSLGWLSALRSFTQARDLSPVTSSSQR